MATVTKRLLTLGLALTFLIGVTAQLSQPPCAGHTPNCVDHLGCITVSALPALPATIAVPVEWTSLDYDPVPETLSGISIKPELSPPILAA